MSEIYTRYEDYKKRSFFNHKEFFLFQNFIKELFSSRKTSGSFCFLFTVLLVFAPRKSFVPAYLRLSRRTPDSRLPR